MSRKGISSSTVITLAGDPTTTTSRDQQGVDSSAEATGPKKLCTAHPSIRLGPFIGPLVYQISHRTERNIMVNVGGRSKGCTTCRKRRVKCDEEYPTCLRCRRSGLECDGPKATSFIIVGKVVKSRRSVKATTRDSDADVEVMKCLSHIPQVSLLSCSNEFEVYICFALKHLRHGGTIELTTRTINPTDIVPARTVATINHSHISHQAILSFAAIFFGSQHHQPDISRAGFALYGRVLQRLNEALSDPAYNTKDDLIFAVVTLSILELFVSTGEGNHLKHMAGLERLFALRDHSLPTSYESAEMYRSLRQMIVFAALRSRKPSILARPEWRKQLREHIGSPDELQKQELFDVLADCSVLIATRDQILNSYDTSPEWSSDRLNKLQQGALSLLAQLSAWRKQWDGDQDHKTTESPLSHSQNNNNQPDPDDDLLPFGTNIEYACESDGITMLLYHTSLIHVLQILALLTIPQPSHFLSESPFISPPATPPLQPVPKPIDNFLRDPAHFPNLWSHPPPSSQQHPINPYLAAQRAPILDICRSISYHTSDPQKATSSCLHWATATVWVKVGGEESVVGRWVWKLLLERKSILLKSLKTLAS